jgi:hypothetical protein
MTSEDQREILAGLEAKLAEATGRATELQTERRRISFAANTGDAAARKALDAANAASGSIAIEIENLQSAIDEAKRRVDAAERGEVREALAENARRAVTIGEHIKQRGRKLDELANGLFAEAEALREDLATLHGLGCAYPSHFQLQSLGERALKSAAMASPFKIEHLAPRERRSFGEMTTVFAETIARWASPFSDKREAA